jgi:hypothetical protein
MPDLDSGAISFGVINYTDASWTYMATVESFPQNTKIRGHEGQPGHQHCMDYYGDSGIEKQSDLKERPSPVFTAAP